MSNRISTFVTMVILAAGITIPSYAQTKSWQVDSNHSDARLSIDRTVNSVQQTITLGATRVSGTINLDKDNLAECTFAFSIYPAGSRSPAIDPNGKPMSGDGLDIANYTLVSFQSEHVSTTSDGNLKVTGKLTTTYVGRYAELTPNEAYAGPVYGARFVQTSTREETFVFVLPAAAVSDHQSHAKVEISASANVNREGFPQLANAVLASNWPSVVQDEQCDMPTAIGEDYAGARCTGYLVQVPPLPVTYTGTGDDYPGPDAVSAQLGNNLEIFVHMQLTEEQLRLSAKASE
jgi:polyisoprenoid-binding protein YceI